MKILNIKIPQNKRIFLSSSGDKINFLLEENNKIFSQYSFKILNQPFGLMRENSRQDIVKRALSFSKKFNPDIEEKINSAPQFIIQTGHQPVFFHPGIWIKNIESFSGIYNIKLEGFSHRQKKEKFLKKLSSLINL